MRSVAVNKKIEKYIERKAQQDLLAARYPKDQYQRAYTYYKRGNPETLAAFGSSWSEATPEQRQARSSMRYYGAGKYYRRSGRRGYVRRRPVYRRRSIYRKRFSGIRRRIKRGAYKSYRRRRYF